MDTELKTELKYFEDHKSEWVGLHKDKYVLIKNKSAIGFFDNMDDAYRVAVEKFDNEAVLIRKVTLKDEPPEELPALTTGVINSFI